MEKIGPSRRTIIIIILGLLVIFTFWISYGLRNSMRINSKSLVTIGEVSEITSEKVYFRFSYMGTTYNSAFDNKGSNLSARDMVYVRFYPPDPRTHIVIFKKTILNEDMEYGTILDSLNSREIHWWEFD
ncbi:MAG: hypothetical protein R2804_08595 [Cyclobacteriaceae bacterium]